MGLGTNNPPSWQVLTLEQRATTEQVIGRMGGYRSAVIRSGVDPRLVSGVMDSVVQQQRRELLRCSRDELIERARRLGL